MYILTPAGYFTTSTDGGHTWTIEKVNFGSPEQLLKTVSLTLDGTGHPLAAASAPMFNPPQMTEEVGHGGYWTIKLSRRAAPGVWEVVPGPLDGRPEWAAPSQPDQDVLADWVRVLADRDGGLHLTWHGTAVSRIYGNDRAYYAWRSPDGAWRAPVSLREPDPGRGYGWSYAPALILDGDQALALVFHVVRDRGFDTDLVLLRDGRSLAPLLPVTRFAENSLVTGEPENALSVWFPSAAPTLTKDAADGRVWADMLLALSPTGVPAPTIIVLYRLDLTAWLKAAGQ